MATIVEINNPFEPLKDTRVSNHDGGVTIFGWLEERFPGFKEFPRPTICLVNGNAILRAQWKTHIIHEKDVVNFVVLQQGPLAIFYAFVAVVSVASIVIALSIPKPNTGRESEPDPVYDLKGQKNQNRAGFPIECPYGRSPLWASYAARPWTQYIGNDQIQYQLLCLGHGTYADLEVRIGDTDISNFQDIEYEIYEPGDEVTLFPDNVITSAEVQGLELLATNEEGFAGPTGGFVANGSGTQTNHLEVDIVFPGGLYNTNDDGEFIPLTVNGFFEYREIDDAGDPVGDWVEFTTFEKTLATNTPQRFTLMADVPEGRYEVRAQRTGNKNLSNRAQNVVRWEQLRAFLPSTKDYGDVTLIAIKARANNNLNDKSSNKINVIATRKLPIWNGSEWSAPTATRSIVWAFCDLFRAAYGARLADNFLNLPELLALDAELTSEGRYFDFVFEQKTSVWEAARTIARMARGVPMLDGSVITIIKDRDPATMTPVAAFNQSNIVAGSFKWDIKLPGLDEFDGMEVTYVNPDTWQQETVLCQVGDDPEEPTNPERITLIGCTDRNIAFREGHYLRWTRKYYRENFSFRTGLEGHIPSYNDLILLAHDVPKIGQAGLAVAYDAGTLKLTLNEPVTFVMGTNVIVLTKKDGSIYGPVTVTAGASPNEVILPGAIDEGQFYWDRIHECPRFFFGLAGQQSVDCKIVGLAPSFDDTVEVRCIRVSGYGGVGDSPFGGDEDDAPSLPPVAIPESAPIVPTGNCSLVRYIPIPNNPRLGRLTWGSALGAISYRVQQSSNGTDWTELGNIAGLATYVPVTPGQSLYLRVAPIGAGGQGPWCSPPDGPGSEDPEDNAPIEPGDDDYDDLFPETNGLNRPINLVAAPGAALIDLTWVDQATNETSYRVERTTNPNDPEGWEILTDALDPNTETYEDSTPVADTLYWYRVRCCTGLGCSRYSNRVGPVQAGAPGFSTCEMRLQGIFPLFEGYYNSYAEALANTYDDYYDVGASSGGRLVGSTWVQRNGLGDQLAYPFNATFSDDTITLEFPATATSTDTHTAFLLPVAGDLTLTIASGDVVEDSYFWEVRDMGYNLIASGEHVSGGSPTVVPLEAGSYIFTSLTFVWATWTITFSQPIQKLPVIVYWDDSGTIRSFEAYPKMLLPPGTEWTGDWFDGDASAQAAIDDYVVDCSAFNSQDVYNFVNSQSFSGTRYDGSNSVAEEPVGLGTVWFAVNLVGGDTATIRCDISGTGSGGCDPMNPLNCASASAEITLYAIDGTIVLAASDSNPSSLSASAIASGTVPYSGKYIVRAVAAAGSWDSESQSGGSGFAEVTSTGDASANPVQAVHFAGVLPPLNCPKRLDC
jgi:sulfur carrier protein ThiS